LLDYLRRMQTGFQTNQRGGLQRLPLGARHTDLVQAPRVRPGSGPGGEGSAPAGVGPPQTSPEDCASPFRQPSGRPLPTIAHFVCANHAAPATGEQNLPGASRPMPALGF
jgi:hypothetical protein